MWLTKVKQYYLHLQGCGAQHERCKREHTCQLPRDIQQLRIHTYILHTLVSLSCKVTTSNFVYMYVHTYVSSFFFEKWGCSGFVELCAFALHITSCICVVSVFEEFCSIVHF